MNLFVRSIFILVALSLSGCATSFKPIRPDKLTYPYDSETSEVKMFYEYGVLEKSRNKRYAKKQEKHHLQLAAVEITNKTNRDLQFNQDLKLFANGKPLELLPPEAIRKKVHQVAGTYLIWGILWFTVSKCEGHDCDVTPIPVGLGIGLLNLAIASGANSNFLGELRRYNLIDKVIKPGETVTGLVGFTDESAPELQIKVVN